MKDQINTIREALNTCIGLDKALTALDQLEAMAGEPYGTVTVVRKPGCADMHWFYRHPEPPYLDNAAECHTVYTAAPVAQQAPKSLHQHAKERGINMPTEYVDEQPQTITPAELANRIERGEKWEVVHQPWEQLGIPGGCTLENPLAQQPQAEAAYQRGYMDGTAKPCADCADYKAMYLKVRDELAEWQQQAEAVPEGYRIVPDWKGYALLGSGQYLINHAANYDPELGAELIITLATEKDREGVRKIGESRPNAEDSPPVQPEEMVIRIGFLNGDALFALEDQLADVRKVLEAAGKAAPQHAEAVPMTLAQIIRLTDEIPLHEGGGWFVDVVRAAERHHGIVGKEGA